MKGLMLHVEANSVTREQLDTVYTPDPDTDRGWFPIPHNILVEQVTDALAATGLQVVSEAHGIAREGRRYFGLLELQSTMSDYTTVVGLRNSHDSGRLPAQTCAGRLRRSRYSRTARSCRCRWG